MKIVRYLFQILYKKGIEHFNEALKWADYAMENRQMWQGGQDYMSKSLQLYRLRGQIATELWIEHEKAYRKNRSPELEAIAVESRGYAKDYAREWLEYARATETDTTQAFNLCVSAAGSATLCQ